MGQNVFSSSPSVVLGEFEEFLLKLTRYRLQLSSRFHRVVSDNLPRPWGSDNYA
jgi:hypothetical protein